MRPFRFFLAVSSLLFVLAGCGDDDSTGDPDAGTDDAGPAMSRLFGSCEEDSQCPGEGAICRHDVDGYPRGYCTIPCEDRTPCDVFGAYHHCVQRDGEDRSYCEHRCLNGADCRPGYTCSGELPPSGGMCIGLCSDDSQCSAGLECEHYSGRCVTSGTTPTGALTGEPCASNDACASGVCLTELNDVGAPSGFVAGLCAGNCVLPTGYNTSTFYSGDTLPRGSCGGETDVCFPNSSQTAEGDLGICLDGCTANTDCRAGYRCAKAFATGGGGNASFDNGVCLPIDCSATACPDGYSCQQVPRGDGSMANVCGPATTT